MGFNRDRKPRRLVCLSMCIVAMSMAPRLAFAQGSSGSAPVTIVSPLPLPVTVMNPVSQGVVYTELVRTECTANNSCEARFTAAPAGMVLRVTRVMGYLRVHSSDVGSGPFL